MIQKIKPWKEISRETMFEKFGRGIDKVVFEQSDGERYDVYVKKEKDVGAVLALTENNEVILVKQFRPGPKKMIYDLPGGIVNDGESAKKMMERELLEETGYEGRVEFVTSTIDCGYSTRIKHCFVATDCKKIKNISNELHDDDGGDRGFKEEKEVVLMSLSEFRKFLHQGQNADIEVGYLGLDYLGLLGKQH